MMKAPAHIHVGIIDDFLFVNIGTGDRTMNKSVTEHVILYVQGVLNLLVFRGIPKTSKDRDFKKQDDFNSLIINC